MEQYITVKREDGVEVTNPQERNLILLRYAAFLNENGDAHLQQPNAHMIQQHQQVAIQIIEQPQPMRKSTKSNVQNAQGANLQQTKVGGLQCHLCSKVLCNSQYLSQHIRVVHENIREHSCNFCDMKFGSKSHLIIHERKHTGERPYVCDVCNKGFAQKSLYSYHKKRAHTTSNQ